MDTNEMKNEELEKVAGGEQKHIKGFVCPRCGYFITVTLYQLAMGEKVFCPSCNTPFTNYSTKCIEVVDPS